MHAKINKKNFLLHYQMLSNTECTFTFKYTSHFYLTIGRGRYAFKKLTNNLGSLLSLNTMHFAKGTD